MEEVLIAVKKVKESLRKVTNIKDRYDYEESLLGNKFNLFRILRKGHEETSVHSALIGELLNPEGKHKCGNLFLKEFLGLINERGYSFSLDTDYKVTIEKAFDLGRMDIVIESSDTCIVIENKIHAGDQGEQLGRYYQYSKEFKNNQILYLTLWGNPPSEQSIGYNETKIPAENYTCISYKEDIKHWLNTCLMQVISKSYIRENILQYLDLLNDLTNTGDKRMAEDIKDVIKEMDIKSIDQIYTLANSLDSLRFDAVNEYFTKIKSELEGDNIIVDYDLGNSKFYTANSIGGTWKEGFFRFKILVVKDCSIDLYFWTEHGYASYYSMISVPEKKLDLLFNSLEKIVDKNLVIEKKEDVIEFSIEDRPDFFNNNKWVDFKFLENKRNREVEILKKIILIISELK